MSYHKFKNREGKSFVLPGHLTIKDLLMMGFSGIGISKKGTPLKPGEYREIGTVTKIPRTK